MHDRGRGDIAEDNREPDEADPPPGRYRRGGVIVIGSRLGDRFYGGVRKRLDPRQEAVAPTGHCLDEAAFGPALVQTPRRLAS